MKGVRQAKKMKKESDFHFFWAAFWPYRNGVRNETEWD